MGHELSSNPSLPDEPNDDDDAISEHSQLLVDGDGARPALLGTDALSRDQQRLDERIRTLCLVVMALAVCAAALYYLQTILVRFVLALALKYETACSVPCPALCSLSFRAQVPAHATHRSAQRRRAAPAKR